MISTLVSEACHLEKPLEPLLNPQPSDTRGLIKMTDQGIGAVMIHGSLLHDLPPHQRDFPFLALLRRTTPNYLEVKSCDVEPGS